MNWFEIANAADVPSPALLFYSERIGANLEEMLRIAGGPRRLRPHLKTHKVAELVGRQLDLGITKFKCATIAEAELAAKAGAEDVLLAYQPVGPHVARFVALATKYQNCRFSCLADHRNALTNLSLAAVASHLRLDVLVDLDVGQHRTGIEPGDHALELYRMASHLPGVRASGLHAYDGHLHDTDLAARTTACEVAFAGVELLQRRLAEHGLEVPRLVAGGTPTFPIHAQRRPDAELSPGTSVLWDAGYAKKLPDLAFLPAAVLLTRVVSKPTPDRLCLDLGHKAVASEMAPPRVIFLNLPDATPVGHNEEHLIVETPHAEAFPIGAPVYGIPWHVCPTVALHEYVQVVEGGRVTREWHVAARARRLTV